MKKALLVAEKPSAMEAIKAAYEKVKADVPYDITFTAAAGHLIGLSEPDAYREDWGSPWRKEVLPMIPDEFLTEVTNPKFFGSIRDEYNKGGYDVVINAGDAGREGQLIQSLIYNKIGVNVPVLRLWASDLTEQTIAKALKNLVPNEEYKGLEDASYMRAYSDWLMGMNFSRAVSLSLARPCRIGRVMTPVLYMIVKRERERADFVPTVYWEDEVTFKTNKGEVYKGLCLTDEYNGRPTPYAIKTEEESKKILSEVKAAGKITCVTKEEKVSHAPALFNLSDLQKACAGRFTPDETLNIAQSLYEKKFISYPRTESRAISRAQTGEAKEILKKVSALLGVSDKLRDEDGINKVLSSKKYVDDKKVTDHPALIPTTIMPDLDSLPDNEKFVYNKIAVRFTAIFMPDLITEETVILTETDGPYTFKTTGVSVKQKGFTEIMESKREKEIPHVTEGEGVFVSNRENLKKQTTAPDSYTDATLLTAMETAGKQVPDEELEKILKECAGLGTAATRAAEIKKLIDIRYIERANKKIIPTAEGIQLVDMLEKSGEGSDILLPDLTAMWEGKLRSIEDGGTEADSYYKVLTAYIEKRTGNYLSLPEIGPFRREIGICPKCGKNFVATHSVYCCEGYLDKEKTCTVAIPAKFGEASISEREAVSLISGGMSKEKNFKWKDGKKTRGKLELNSDFKLSFARDVVGKCPKCGRDVLKGQYGYYCENYKECGFTLAGKIGETHVSEEIIKQILDTGKSKNAVSIRWKSGKTIKRQITYEENEKGGYWLTTVSEEKHEVCKCPRCGNTVYHQGKRFFCGEPECDFSIFESYLGAVMSDEDMTKLCAHEKVIKDITINYIDKKTKKPAEFTEPKEIRLRYGYRPRRPSDTSPKPQKTEYCWYFGWDKKDGESTQYADKSDNKNSSKGNYKRNNKGSYKKNYKGSNK